MATVSIHMPEQSGQSGLSLYLRKTSDGTLVNTGGDSLTESPASSGRFTATVAETWAETLAASVQNASSLIVRDGWLAEGETIVRDAYPSSGGGGGAGDAEQATSLEIQETVEAIAASIAGASKVEVVSRVAEGGDVTAYIGDDFRVRSDTQLEIPVADVAGALFTKLDTIGAANLNFSASRPAKGPGEITGTVADIVQDSATQLTIVVEIVNCGSGLIPDDYNYQIEQTQDHSSETDSFVEIEGTLTLKWKS